MADHSLCKQDLIDYLKSEKADTAKITNANHYIYSAGSNALIDKILIKIAAGDFDQTKA